MPELNDATLSALATICQTSNSPDFSWAVRNAVLLAHFRGRIKRHAHSVEKISSAAATLLREIEALDSDALAMIEEIISGGNDIAVELLELAGIHAAEHLANRKYDQQETPRLYSFLEFLLTFEYAAHWVAGLPAPYVLTPPGHKSLYLEIGISGKPLSRRRGRGRPKGGKGLSSAFRNLEILIDHLIAIAANSGGRLTFSDQHNSGSLIEALTLLSPVLPLDCRAIPPRSTMRRIKERSTGHLHRLTPEQLYKGVTPLAKREHYEAIKEALRAVGVDPAATDETDIACAAEIHAREGAPPDAAFQIAVGYGLIERGYMVRKVYKKAFPHTFKSRKPTRPRKSKIQRTKRPSSKE